MVASESNQPALRREINKYSREINEYERSHSVSRPTIAQICASDEERKEATLVLLVECIAATAQGIRYQRRYLKRNGGKCKLPYILSILAFCVYLIF